MSEFQVMLQGISPNAQRSEVVAKFAERFQMAVEKAEQVFARCPTVIKKNLDRAAADRYAQVLTQLGVIVEVQAMKADLSLVPIESSASADEAPAAAKASISAPPVVAASAKAEGKSPSGYQYRIEGQPDYAFVTVTIPAGETLKVEASAMATMDTNLVMKTKFRGGLGRLVTGESMFLNEFTAQGGPAEIGIAPGAPGDLRHLYLNDEIIYLQNSAYVASTEGVDIATKWQGLTRGFFSGESFFLIKAEGRGDLFFSSYGGIIEVDVDGDYVVDTGNIVAFTDGLQYSINKLGSYKSLFFSGEGLVCRFNGRGKVWVQTRKAAAFVAWAWPFRPVKSRG
ncbi:MAG: TIGR00266 family protein [Spongiibacteraceae bacterium]